jgi:hypothetical protein
VVSNKHVSVSYRQMGWLRTQLTLNPSGGQTPQTIPEFGKREKSQETLTFIAKTNMGSSCSYFSLSPTHRSSPSKLDWWHSFWVPQSALMDWFRGKPRRKLVHCVFSHNILKGFLQIVPPFWHLMFETSWITKTKNANSFVLPPVRCQQAFRDLCASVVVSPANSEKWGVSFFIGRVRGCVETHILLVVLHRQRSGMYSDVLIEFAVAKTNRVSPNPMVY